MQYFLYSFKGFIEAKLRPRLGKIKNTKQNEIYLILETIAIKERARQWLDWYFSYLLRS